MIKPLNQMDLLEKRTEPLCFGYQEHLEERRKEETLSTLFSQLLISTSLSCFSQNELMPLALSTNSTNYIKQFDIS